MGDVAREPIPGGGVPEVHRGRTEIPPYVPDYIYIDGRNFGVNDHISYRLQRPLGGGREGMVWLISPEASGLNTLIPQRLALKAARPGWETSLQSEASTLLKLQKVEARFGTHHVPRIFLTKRPGTSEKEEENYLLNPVLIRLPDNRTTWRENSFIMEELSSDYKSFPWEIMGDLGRLDREFFDYQMLLDFMIQYLDVDLICLEAGIRQTDRKTDDYRFNPQTHHLMVLDWGVKAIIRNEDDIRMANRYAVEGFGYNLIDLLAEKSILPKDFRLDLPTPARGYDWIRQHLPLPMVLVIRDVFFEEPGKEGQGRIAKSPQEVIQGLLRIYKDLIDQAREHTTADLEVIKRRLEAIDKMRKSSPFYPDVGWVRTYLAREKRAMSEDLSEERINEVAIPELKTNIEELRDFRRWVAEREAVLRIAMRLKVDEEMVKTHDFPKGALFDQYNRIAERVGLGKDFLLD